MDKNVGPDLRILTPVIILVIAVFAFLFLKPFTIIGPGQRGVVMKFGKVQPYVLGEGIHYYLPVITSVKKISVRVQKDDVKAEAASKDLQVVNFDVVINWHIDPSKVNQVFQNVGDEVEVVSRVINPALSEVVKAAAAQKNAEEIITKRPELKEDIDKRLVIRLKTYNIIVNDVSLVDIDFSGEFNAAIESKQVAEQETRKAQFVADKAKKEAEAILNRARGEAEAQKLQQQTLSAELLQKMAIEKWDGHFPTYYGGNVLPFLNIGR